MVSRNAIEIDSPYLSMNHSNFTSSKYTLYHIYIHILFFSETDRYFRRLVEIFSSEYKRSEANREKHDFDFASIMMANVISEEKAERNAFKIKEIPIGSRPHSKLFLSVVQDDYNCSL